MSRTIIISNRLPIKIEPQEDGFTYQTSAGGLATGLGSIYKEGDNLWIGWPGISVETEEDYQKIETDLSKENLVPVFLTEEEIQDFYEGFSNATLWPIFHYFARYAVFEETFWESYKSVNQKFCDIIIKHLRPDDTVWVHDYQLLLLPGMLREHFKDISIGFFQHIPFPSYEVFRSIPWRRELLMGMLGSDLIGFHTYDDMRHFLSSVNRLAGIGYEHGQISVENRQVTVDAFPMGIDYEKYAKTATLADTLAREARYRKSMGDEKIILSIDRLDYSKGIPQRLRALELFFEQYPEYLQKVSLFMIVVPSRDNVERYRLLKVEIDELVGRINGKFGRINWSPIHYFYRSFPLEALSAFYRMAEVALVTPLRDGMNLVCKEYIASKIDQKGVLILSEMAGSAKELSEALLINPFDIKQIVSALKEALEMPIEEQKKHMEIMQMSLKRYNIHHWVSLFLDRLAASKAQQKDSVTRKLDSTVTQEITESYQKANKRLIFLDYDGTLAPFTKDPGQAKPTPELLKLLTKLSEDKKNHLVVISGRGRDSLGVWLKDMPLDLICEHGIWRKEQGKEWHKADNISDEWKQTILPVLDLYVNRTPGSFVEEKNYSLVWHYRKVETGLGELRTRELSSHLKYLTNNMQLQVLEGNMVVEIKPAAVNKGVASKIWLEKFPSDFVIALGDDRTDEDTFKALPDDAFTVKVGFEGTDARFFVPSTTEVYQLLHHLSEK
jgi:trehalose 6-phosphate synthase/phosphatase